MNTSDKKPKEKSELLEIIFPYLVRQGLENITIRELCKGTKLVQGTLYYYFGNKTTIICDSVLYGLKKVTDEIFEYAFAHINNLQRFFSECFSQIGKYQNELRFIYQAAASPIYGEKIRSAGNGLDYIYHKYTENLSAELKCDKKLLEPLVYLFTSAVLDYIIWGEKEKSQMQLEYIYSALPAITQKK